MRGLCLQRLNGPFAPAELPEPVAGPQEVLVEVAFAAVNPLDIWVSQGSIGAAAANLPWVPGTEATGYVASKPVLVRGGGLGVTRPGLARERAAVQAETVLYLPEGLDLALAAALGTAGTTAWNAVHTKAQVERGDRVVVLGASGGVGSVAVQLARTAGAEVWGHTGSQAKVSSIRHAHHVLYAPDGPALQDQLREIRPTVVLDALGSEYTSAAIEGLEPGGRLVVYGTSSGERADVNIRTVYRKGLTIHGYTNLNEPLARQHAVLSALFESLMDGTLEVPHEIIPLEQAGSAHSRLLERSVAGRLVIDCHPAVHSDAPEARA